MHLHRSTLTIPCRDRRTFSFLFDQDGAPKAVLITTGSIRMAHVRGGEKAPRTWKANEQLGWPPAEFDFKFRSALRVAAADMI